MTDTVSSTPRWYAVQCLSNHEDKVRRFLTRFREDDENFSKHLKEILVPIETVSEVKVSREKKSINKILIYSSLIIIIAIIIYSIS